MDGRHRVSREVHHTVRIAASAIPYRIRVRRCRRPVRPLRVGRSHALRRVVDARSHLRVRTQRRAQKLADARFDSVVAVAAAAIAATIIITFIITIIVIGVAAVIASLWADFPAHLVQLDSPI